MVVGAAIGGESPCPPLLSVRVHEFDGGALTQRREWGHELADERLHTVSALRRGHDDGDMVLSCFSSGVVDQDTRRPARAATSQLAML